MHWLKPVIKLLIKIQSDAIEELILIILTQIFCLHLVIIYYLIEPYEELTKFGYIQYYIIIIL